MEISKQFLVCFAISLYSAPLFITVSRGSNYVSFDGNRAQEFVILATFFKQRHEVCRKWLGTFAKRLKTGREMGVLVPIAGPNPIFGMWARFPAQHRLFEFNPDMAA